MGAPNIVGAITGDVTENSGLVISGNLDDSNPFWTNDAWSITGSPTYGTVTINPTTGVWSYDLNDTNPVVHALNTGDTLIDTFTVRLTDTGGSDTQVVTITIHGAPCFTPGTRIEMARGFCAVEDIAVGDMVRTRDNGLQPVRWTGRRTVNATGDLAPIKIRAGALGNHRDLLVSPQHRILISGWQAELHFGCPEVLVAARHLVTGHEISTVEGADVTYVHLSFDHHELIYAEGLLTESFFTGGALAAEMAKTDPSLRRHLADQRRAGLQGPTARPCLDASEAGVMSDVHAPEQSLGQAAVIPATSPPVQDNGP